MAALVTGDAATVTTDGLATLMVAANDAPRKAEFGAVKLPLAVLSLLVVNAPSTVKVPATRFNCSRIFTPSQRIKHELFAGTPRVKPPDGVVLPAAVEALNVAVYAVLLTITYSLVTGGT